MDRMTKSHTQLRYSVCLFYHSFVSGLQRKSAMASLTTLRSSQKAHALGRGSGVPWTDDEKLRACLARDTELLRKSLSAAHVPTRSTFVSSDRCTRESRIGTERVSENPAVAEKVRTARRSFGSPVSSASFERHALLFSFRL